jgi:hypothetical protein
MKKITVLFLFFFFMYQSKAQNEFYIPWINDSFSFDGGYHITDDSGNLYILSTLDAFDALNGSILYGGTAGNALVKIDKNNNVLWRKNYYNYNTGSQALFWNNSIYIPYDIYIGFSICTTSYDTIGPIIDTSLSAMESSISAGLFINSITGDTIHSPVFYDGKSCGSQFDLYSYVDGNLWRCGRSI